ncbi:hypothetical protein BU17DRAFT_77661 [Hysterangium stoloniferum]|nr:hypothetical protein BU17DRAFT_77661 [Hysterangium stoloniferum]
MRQHAQRRHIIRSIDRLCYQLFVLSFLQAPSLLQLVARSTSQFQLSRPRDFDGDRSLRFWVFILCCANTGSLLNHITYHASEVASRKGLILDFIGMANLPSKTELLTLDCLIIFLQLIVLCISYETSLSLALPPDHPDPLSPDDIQSTGIDLESSSKLDSSRSVLHLRFRPTMRRILDPPPLIPRANSSDLPLPNTTPFIFPSTFRTRSRAQGRREATMNEGEGRTAPERVVPGGLDVG